MVHLQQSLSALLRKAVTDGQIAGGNLLILRAGQELAYAQAGFADIEQNRPYRRDTIFRLYSMTKPITATAAMILVQRGQLDLGKPLGDILPEFRNVSVYTGPNPEPPRRSILIKDLLSMTSGLSYGSEDPAGRRVWELWGEVDRRLYSDRPITTRELAGRLAQAGLSFHPGEKWMYGTSADVLGAVIEQVSGMPFGDFLQAELFTPLGMTDTAFYVPREKQGRLAQAYEATPEGLRLYRTNHLGIRYSQDMPPAFQSGGAGLVSTLDDYANFAEMLMSGGTFRGRQILSPHAAEYLTQGKLTPWQRQSMWQSWESLYGYDYGNLMRIMAEPGMGHFMTWQGEYGWDGWLGAYFINSPRNGITVLLSVQKRDAGTMELTRKIRNVLAAHID